MINPREKFRIYSSRHLTIFVSFCQKNLSLGFSTKLESNGFTMTRWNIESMSVVSLVLARERITNS